MYKYCTTKGVTHFVEQTCTTDYHTVFRCAEEGQISGFDPLPRKNRCQSARKKTKILKMSTSLRRYVQIPGKCLRHFLTERYRNWISWYLDVSPSWCLHFQYLLRKNGSNIFSICSVRTGLIFRFKCFLLLLLRLLLNKHFCELGVFRS